MKDTYIQNKVIEIAANSGTTTQSFLFKADDCYPYLSGISVIFGSSSSPSADDIQFELRSDFETILSFSPSANWLKYPLSNSFNLQDVFKPLCIEAKGRNFYFDVKTSNNAAFSFVVLLKQTINPLECVRYDEQTFDCKNAALGQSFAITLPSDYDKVKGVMLSHSLSLAVANYIAFEIYDSLGQIVDPLPVSVLTPTVNTQYDNGFFPVTFDSKSKQIFVRFTALDPAVVYSASDFSVTFLLV